MRLTNWLRLKYHPNAGFKSNSIQMFAYQKQKLNLSRSPNLVLDRPPCVYSQMFVAVCSMIGGNEDQLSKLILIHASKATTEHFNEQTLAGKGRQILRFFFFLSLCWFKQTSSWLALFRSPFWILSWHFAARDSKRQASEEEEEAAAA